MVGVRRRPFAEWPESVPGMGGGFVDRYERPAASRLLPGVHGIGGVCTGMVITAETLTELS